ncbi:hypothetical protein ACQHIV_38115 [Kribbella sp. GL6]|uniref:hypothetical protein n=1 Tax=Kribbella sp. GL6 TaxID=3419765 RepID=UPI003D035146
MSPGVALALLSLIQLGLVWLADRTTKSIDHVIFVQQLDTYGTAGIKDLLVTPGEGDTRGSIRTAEVLRLAGFASAARATITALVVTCASLIVTAAIVGRATPEPRLATLRLWASIVGAIVTGVAVFLLLIKLVNKKLKAQAPGEVPQESWSLKNYWARLRCRDVLTRYLTIALLGNVVAIVAVVGI